VSTYRTLGPTLPLLAVPDQGLTPYQIAGNWTVTADQQSINSHVAQAEIHQINIQSGPVSSSVKIYINNRLWNTVAQGWWNTYDPVNPMYIRPGDQVFMYWNSSNNPMPTVTFWMRYDIDLPENRHPV
jgi:hypothetical protein